MNSLHQSSLGIYYSINKSIICKLYRTPPKIPYLNLFFSWRAWTHVQLLQGHIYISIYRHNLLFFSLLTQFVHCQLEAFFNCHLNWYKMKDFSVKHMQNWETGCQLDRRKNNSVRTRAPERMQSLYPCRSETLNPEQSSPNSTCIWFWAGGWDTDRIQGSSPSRIIWWIFSTLQLLK